MTELVPLKRALISVSNKANLVSFAKALASGGVELLSTGGTAAAMREAGLTVLDVSEVTGFPEMMDGRVKTLHPKIHGGLLAVRGNAAHEAAMVEHQIPAIDLLVSNLYPFEETVAGGADYDTGVENIDIGGPAMIRAAAKNHAHVTVLTDPEDYDALLGQLSENEGATDLAFRKSMAAIAFGRTAAYDAAVSGWLTEELGDCAPRRRVFAGTIAEELRYGENPHQHAVFYRDGSARPGVATAVQHQGKALSYNNINDTDAAFELVSEFPPADGPACAIIKHANPCGVARGATLLEAYTKAHDCDRVSAFGGIVALNQTLDAATAEAISQIFTEVVIAPGVEDGALEVFAAKPNLRLLTTGGLANPSARGVSVRQVAGGFLVQDRDNGRVDPASLGVVTKRVPTEEELSDMLFAATVAKHVKSNAIVYVKDGATVGVGAGQMSRVDAARIAVRKAQDMAETLGLTELPTTGCVAASDAFFPFPDGLDVLAEAGAKAVIQPGGSVRDEAVIEAADAKGLAMVFTGQRHFRH